MTEDAPMHDALEDAQAFADDLARLDGLKRAKAELENEIDYLQASIAKDMQAEQISEIEFNDHEGRPIKATVVTGTTRTLDLAALAEMDESLANAVSKRVVDTERWKKAEAMGLLSQAKFTNLVRVKPKKPYILFTAPMEETEDA
jgi:hypothetical protein